MSTLQLARDALMTALLAAERDGDEWAVCDQLRSAIRAIDIDIAQEPVGYLGSSAAAALMLGKHVTTTITKHAAFENDVTIYATPQQPAAPEWIPVTERLPNAGVPVLADTGSKYPIRAAWIAKFSEELCASDCFDNSDYDEKTDTYYWPEGWYEWNEHEETHWLVDDAVIGWMSLPPAPKA